jgi:diaminopimelate decarboxylase
MLRPNAVRAKMRDGQEVYGLFCSIPAPVLVEMIGCAGYDFTILDTEHTLVSPQELENLIRAAEAVELTPFVRVPENDPGAVLRALDAGAMGVVVPHVRERADIDAAIQAARYAPEGNRSLNGGRVPGFGRINLTEYVSLANSEIMVVPMIEDAEGVDNLPYILAGAVWTWSSREPPISPSPTACPGRPVTIWSARRCARCRASARSTTSRSARCRAGPKTTRSGGRPGCALSSSGRSGVSRRGPRARTSTATRRPPDRGGHRIWPESSRNYPKRRTMSADDVRKLVLDRAHSEEPVCLYAYDLDALGEHVRSVVAALPDRFRMFYAMRSNSAEPVLRTFAPLVAGFDVASGGEIDKVRAVDGTTRIAFGGPAKTAGDIELALDQRVDRFHVESPTDLARVSDAADRHGRTVKVLLRVNLRGPFPDSTLAMAGRPTRFGIDEADLADVVALMRRLLGVRLVGFHLHSLSNNLSAEVHLGLLEMYASKVAEWERDFDLRCEVINVGGGIGVNYADLDAQFDWSTFASGLSGVAGHFPDHCGEIAFECGRFLTAACGYYAVEVLDLKRNHGQHYALVRGGTHHFGSRRPGSTVTRSRSCRSTTGASTTPGPRFARWN